MAECIHGFDEGLCDICFPRVAPEPPPTVTASSTRGARGTATASPPRRAPKRHAGAAAVGGIPKQPPFIARRLYHVTHLRNLESILIDGQIRAIGSGLTPDLDVAAPIIRELRAHADVGDGRHVADLVPFTLSPDAERWVELRTGAEGAQWSQAARTTTATDYAVLVVVARNLAPELVVADGDASAPGTRFSLGDPARAVAQVARLDPELITAEVLAPGPVPLASVDLIAVGNDPIRARVRQMFADVEGAAPRVVVHPPWFAAAV